MGTTYATWQIMLGATGCGFYASFLYPRDVLQEILTAARRERMLTAKLVTYGLALGWFLIWVPLFTFIFQVCSLISLQRPYGWLLYVLLAIIVTTIFWYKRHLQRLQS